MPSLTLNADFPLGMQFGVSSKKHHHVDLPALADSLYPVLAHRNRRIDSLSLCLAFTSALSLARICRGSEF